jgi:hypothetical protein
MEKVMVGKQASSYVSDPWEFGTACGVGPFAGSVTDQDAASVLISLDAPIRYKEVNYVCVRATPRHEQGPGAIVFNRDTPMNLTLYDKYFSLLAPNPDLQWTLTVIGSVQLFEVL